MSPARWRSALAVAPVLGLAALLVVAIADLPAEPGGLAARFDERLPEAGVSHPVTAVLLNFRGYDTWFETAVLLLAALGLLALRGSHDLAGIRRPAAGDPVLDWLTRLLVPLMVLAAGYLLWLGSHAPGGAFQAGAVLAAALVLLFAAGDRSMPRLGRGALRLALGAGVIAFLLVAFATLAAGRRMLELPAGGAGTLIVLLEAAVTLAVAVTLAALFAGASPDEDGGHGP